MNYLFASLVGLIGGVTSGLFGVGGGIIMVPALVLLLKQDMKVAVATSLAVIVPTTLAGTILNQSMGRIDWRFVASKRSFIIRAQILRTARNLAASSKTCGPAPSMNVRRGANSSTSSPRSSADCT